MPDQPREEARVQRFTVHACPECAALKDDPINGCEYCEERGGHLTPHEVVELDPLRALADEWEAEAERMSVLGSRAMPAYLACARQLRERIGDGN